MITNKYNLPLSLSVWLAHSDYDAYPNSKTISATSLLKPLKSIILSMRSSESGSTDVMDLVPSSMGTAIHTAIESAWKSPNLLGTLALLGYPEKVINSVVINPFIKDVSPNVIPIYMEIRNTKNILDWNITGKFDFICNGMLEDFKSTGTYNYISQSNSTKYIQQASIYRWLNPEIVTEDVFGINYIFTDWSSVKAKQEKDYPKQRIIQQKYPLMGMQETEQFIKNKVKLIDAHWNDETLPLPDCTAEELWMRPSVFKYYKNPEKMERSTKNFDTYWEAHQKFTEDGSVGKIVEVKGEAVFCKYCAARNICQQAKQYINEGRLVV